MSSPHDPNREAQARLTLALRNVTAATASDVVSLAASWGCRPTRRKPDPSTHYPGGVDVHSFVEICIALTGASALNLEDTRFAMRPSRFAVVEPERPHVEGYLRSDRPYTLMWLSGRGDLTAMIVSQFTPETGWSIPVRMQLRSAAANRLNALASDGLTWMKPRDFEMLRQAVLAVLCALHVQAADQAATAEQGGRQVRRNRHGEMIEHIRQLLEEDVRAELDLEQLAALARLTPNYLNTLFRRQIGQSIHAYRQARRMDEAHRMLQRGELLVKEVAQRLGFDDPLYFSRAFRRHFGVWPTGVEHAAGPSPPLSGKNPDRVRS